MRLILLTVEGKDSSSEIQKKMTSGEGGRVVRGTGRDGREREKTHKDKKQRDKKKEEKTTPGSGEK